MRENDVDIVKILIEMMPEENEQQKRIKLYMQIHQTNCNEYVYAKYQREATFFNSILKALRADLGAEIMRTFADKNMI